MRAAPFWAFCPFFSSTAQPIVRPKMAPLRHLIGSETGEFATGMAAFTIVPSRHSTDDSHKPWYPGFAIFHQQSSS